MSVSVSTVKATQPDKLVDAAADMGRKYGELQAVITGERETLSALQEHWTGQAGSAAISQGLKYVGIQVRVATRLQQLQSALHNGGLQLAALRSAIMEMVQSLQEWGFAVADDGTVTPHQWLVGRFLDGLAEKFTTAVKKLLQTFDDVDRATAAALDQADGPSIPNPPLKIDGHTIAIPSQDTAPEYMKKWWDSLTDEQRQELIAAHPPVLGNLDGIPAEVRDKVNVAVMDDDLDRVENVAHQHGVSTDDVVNDPGRYGLSADDVTRYQNAQKTQQGLMHDLGLDGDGRRYGQISAQERIAGNMRPTMLWAYDPTAFGGKGRAAIAIGNPDRSPNTAVIVPGTGSSVKNGWLNDGHNDAINLYDQSGRADPNNPTAVIAWMGYDTPESFTDPNIANPGLARAGGDALAWDVNSLGVTHEAGVPQHVTVIGHSYGSTTVADAFAGSGMQANDAVLLGCPGTDLAHSAQDFHLNGGQVFVGDASTDPVGWLGEAGTSLPNGLNDSLGNLVGSSAGLGDDPAHAGFGAVRFKAEVPGSDFFDTSDHSHYYFKGSEALHSMTDIVSGHSDRLAGDGMLAAPRSEITLATPGHIHIPGLGDVPVPGIEVHTPVTYDPEWDRSGDSVTDDHDFK
jgi:hypothetical protein